MNDWLLPLLMVPLFVVFFYFSVEHLKRAETRASPQKLPRGQDRLDGHAADLEPLQKKLHAVQADLAAVAHRRAISSGGKSDLLTRSREKLRRLGFFQHPPEFTEAERKAH